MWDPVKSLQLSVCLSAINPSTLPFGFYQVLNLILRPRCLRLGGAEVALISAVSSPPGGRQVRLPEESKPCGVLLAAGQVLSRPSCFLLQSREVTLRFFASLVLMGVNARTSLCCRFFHCMALAALDSTYYWPPRSGWSNTPPLWSSRTETSSHWLATW